MGWSDRHARTRTLGILPGARAQVGETGWRLSFVSFTWIFFRAETLPEALLIIRRIATAGWGTSNVPLLMVALVASVWSYAFLYESRFRDFLKTGPVRVGLAVAMVVYLCLCASGGGAFIYFQF